MLETEAAGQMPADLYIHPPSRPSRVPHSDIFLFGSPEW